MMTTSSDGRWAGDALVRWRDVNVDVDADAYVALTELGYRAKQSMKSLTFETRQSDRSI